MKRRHFNDNDYKAIRKAVKSEIPFKVSVRRNRRYETVDIFPVKKDQEAGGWTSEQIREIVKFVDRHNLIQRYGGPIVFSEALFNGIGYLYQSP